MGKIISRQEAKEKGLKSYFTGKPCKHGHISPRTIQSCTCMECNKINSEKWNNENKEIKKKLWREWYNENKGEYLTKLRERLEDQRGVRSERFKKWYYANREQNIARANNLRLKRQSARGKITKHDIAELRNKQKNKCAYCKIDTKKSFHVDHIMPLHLGGDNLKRNLQILCPKCNLSKGHMHPNDFANRIGLIV